MNDALLESTAFMSNPLIRGCALTMKGFLTNANAPLEHFKNNRTVLEVADVFVPLLKQPLDYLKVPLYPNIILFFRHNATRLTRMLELDWR